MVLPRGRMVTCSMGGKPGVSAKATALQRGEWHRERGTAQGQGSEGGQV